MAHTIVIFGASGDLTSRKLIPALYELHRKKRLPENTRIVGYSRTRFTHEAWREKLAETTAQFVGEELNATMRPSHLRRFHSVFPMYRRPRHEIRSVPHEWLQNI